MRKTRTEFKPYYKSCNIDLLPGTNSINFANLGTTTCTINKMWPLQAVVAPSPVGGQLSIEGNENEIDNTKYSVTFETGAGFLLVTWKVFEDIENG